MDESTFHSEDQFLSPDDSRVLLSALEDSDRRKLAHGRQVCDTEDGGSFISPGEESDTLPLSSPYPVPKEENLPDPASQPGIPVQELLSRIAREVQSIKAELGALKPTQSEAPTVDHAEVPVPPPASCTAGSGISAEAQDDVKRLLVYLDRLLESLPEAKVDEFARSEYFDLYRKVFDYYDLA